MGFEIEILSDVGSRVWQETSEEGRMTNRPKRCDYNNKDEDNNPKAIKLRLRNSDN